MGCMNDILVFCVKYGLAKTKDVETGEADPNATLTMGKLIHA